ncbi:MAG: hypothetical protein NTY33_03320 [Candidatus Moranbacteria bacterium]|nr:hypothetical protein [Candidatus Moranbacteria bacterium]
MPQQNTNVVDGDGDDAEDYIVPPKSAIGCPSCRENAEKRKNCFLCKGRGIIFVSEEHTQWIEEE